MVFACRSVRHSRYHENTEPSLGVAQPAHPRLHPPSTTLNTLPATPLSFVATRNPSSQTAPGYVTHEVAPKAIAKNKVKGDEGNVWSDLGCPRVSIIQTSWVPSPLLHDVPAHVRPRLCPNMFGRLSVGRIFRGVRLSDTGHSTTSLSSSLSAASSLSASVSAATSRNEMPYQFFGAFDRSSPGDSNERLMRFVLSLVLSCPV